MTSGGRGCFSKRLNWPLRFLIYRAEDTIALRWMSALANNFVLSSIVLKLVVSSEKVSSNCNNLNNSSVCDTNARTELLYEQRSDASIS